MADGHHAIALRAPRADPFTAKGTISRRARFTQCVRRRWSFLNWDGPGALGGGRRVVETGPMGARVNDARSMLAGTRKLFFDNVRSVNIGLLFGLGFDTGPRSGCWWSPAVLPR